MADAIEKAHDERASLVSVVAALFVAGLAFRAPIIAVGPLLPDIQGDLGISHGTAGLLTSIPALCMALLAPVGTIVARAIGPRSAVAACLVVVAVFGMARSVVPWFPAVLGATVGLGLGMGMIGPIFTMVVSGSAPRNTTLGTAAYATGYTVGATIAAALAVPLAAVLGGWRGVFVGIAAVSLAILPAWGALAPSARHVRVAPTRPDIPWRQPLGWLLGLAFGLQSLLYYGCVVWLPSIYIERGWNAADAAALAALLTGLGIPVTFLVPLVARALRSRRTQLAVSSVVAIAGAIGIAAGPSGPPASTGLIAVGSVFAVALGVGIFFPISLALPADVAATPSESSSLAALMLLVGYLLSATAPVVLGAARDATGDFGAAAWMLAGVAVLMLLACLPLSDRRLRKRAVPA